MGRKFDKEKIKLMCYSPPQGGTFDKRKKKVKIVCLSPPSTGWEI
jgi:hypothetical protein